MNTPHDTHEGMNFIVVEQTSSVSVPTLIGENQQDFQSNNGQYFKDDFMRNT